MTKAKDMGGRRFTVNGASPRAYRALVHDIGEYTTAEDRAKIRDLNVGSKKRLPFGLVGGIGLVIERVK